MPDGVEHVVVLDAVAASGGIDLQTWGENAGPGADRQG